MENSVAIYKNMEVVSGVNMFISQTGPRTQDAHNENAAENNKHNTGPKKKKNLVSDTTLASRILKKLLSPFFWMREDDEPENSSQHTNGDHNISTPQDAPNFSDIMESDDDLHSKGTPNKKNCMA
ncbi:hypothetical protein LIER_38927 [Lithospermum erythrorhizon]|uniref:Uncharacterized protein n=1 Tax=Lithospermum erythrorhizon TaxID=34254 RepID=A0AAV3QC93_LITER